jgi:hypothetical protein
MKLDILKLTSEFYVIGTPTAESRPLVELNICKTFSLKYAVTL